MKKLLSTLMGLIVALHVLADNNVCKIGNNESVVVENITCNAQTGEIKATLASDAAAAAYVSVMFQATYNPPANTSGFKPIVKQFSVSGLANASSTTVISSAVRGENIPLSITSGNNSFTLSPLSVVCTGISGRKCSE